MCSTRPVQQRPHRHESERSESRIFFLHCVRLLFFSDTKIDALHENGVPLGIADAVFNHFLFRAPVSFPCTLSRVHRCAHTICIGVCQLPRDDWGLSKMKTKQYNEKEHENQSNMINGFNKFYFGFAQFYLTFNARIRRIRVSTPACGLASVTIEKREFTRCQLTRIGVWNILRSLFAIGINDRMHFSWSHHFEIWLWNRRKSF